jgi:hypothetical protein
LALRGERRGNEFTLADGGKVAGANGAGPPRRGWKPFCFITSQSMPAARGWLASYARAREVVVA